MLFRSCHRAILVARHLAPKGFSIVHVHGDGKLERQDAFERRLMAADEAPLLAGVEDTRALLPLADQEDFEVEFQNGVLQILFEDPAPAKFVVSPNAPVRQIWVSAMSRSYKLGWDSQQRAFVLDGETLSALLERLARDQTARRTG